MTPNQIVASNIARIRTEMGLSRKALADILGWTESRVVDLEHGRDRRPSPKPDEIFALCNRLPITVFDLFMPPPGTDDVDLPLDAMDPHTLAEVAQPVMDRGQYGQMLFSMPARYLEPDSLPGMFKTLASDSLRRAILAQHPKVVELLKPIEDEHRHVASELLVALAAAGVMRGIGADGELMEPTEVLAAIEERFGPRLSPPMGVEEARSEDQRLRNLGIETTDYGVDQVERQIRQGLLPGPREPEDPVDAWVQHVRGNDEQFETLVNEWFTQIEDKAERNGT